MHRAECLKMNKYTFVSSYVPHSRRSHHACIRNAIARPLRIINTKSSTHRQETGWYHIRNVSTPFAAMHQSLCQAHTRILIMRSASWS